MTDTKHDGSRDTIALVVAVSLLAAQRERWTTHASNDASYVVGS